VYLEGELTSRENMLLDLRGQVGRAQTDALEMFQILDDMHVRVERLSADNLLLTRTLDEEKASGIERLREKDAMIEAQIESLDQLQESNKELWIQCSEFSQMNRRIDKVDSTPNEETRVGSEDVEEIVQEKLKLADRRHKEEIEVIQRKYSEDTESLQTIINDLDDELRDSHLQREHLRESLKMAQEASQEVKGALQRLTRTNAELLAQQKDMHNRYTEDVEDSKRELFEKMVLQDNEYAELETQYEKLRDEYLFFQEQSQSTLNAMLLTSKGEVERLTCELQQLQDEAREKVSLDSSELVKEREALYIATVELKRRQDSLDTENAEMRDEMRQRALLASIEHEQTRESSLSPRSVVSSRQSSPNMADHRGDRADMNYLLEKYILEQVSAVLYAL
jgi:hypothetical protein